MMQALAQRNIETRMVIFHVDTKLGGADGSQDSILFDAAILKQNDGTSTGRFVFYDLAKQKEEATALMSSNDDAAKASSFVKK